MYPKGIIKKVKTKTFLEFNAIGCLQLSNEYGDSTGKSKFRLHEAPAIVEALKDQEFLEANTAKIVLKATGVPVPEIKWSVYNCYYYGFARECSDVPVPEIKWSVYNCYYYGFVLKASHALVPEIKWSVYYCSFEFELKRSDVPVPEMERPAYYYFHYVFILRESCTRA